MLQASFALTDSCT